MSLYTASIPAYLQHLNATLTLLDKAIAHCAAKKWDQSVLLNERVFPDMFPLVRQFQYVADHAWNSAARLNGDEPAPPPREETSLEQLKDRISKAIAVVQAVSAAKVDANADKEITFPVGPKKATMRGADYMLHFATPNFYFHLTTAYNIMRARGIEVGKWDFLGAVPSLKVS
jgi:hypothetical protein